MEKQSADHFLRFYPLHHFIFYPVMALLAVACFYYGTKHEDFLPWALGGCGFISLMWLSFMLRQHYALLLQDRIIRLELRYRYFSLTGKKLEALENKLTDAQLFSLRFAPDTEFEALAERAVSENLSPEAIRHAIGEWMADEWRV